MQIRLTIRKRIETIGFGWITTRRAERIATKPMSPDQNCRLRSAWWFTAMSASAEAHSRTPPGSVQAGA